MATGEGAAPSIADAPRPSARAIRWPRLGDTLEARFDAERDQLPLWLPVGLLTGISAWFWLLGESGRIAFLVAALALAFGLAATAGGWRWGRALAIFALAMAAGTGLIWWQAEQVAAPRLERSGLMTFTGTVETVQAVAAPRPATRIVIAPEGEGLPARLRVSVREGEAPEGLAPGARVSVRAWMMPPAPMAVPGGYDFERNAWFQRIGGTGRALDIAVIAPASASGWRMRIADWRQRLGAHVRSRIAGEGEAGIAATLVTGDQLGIPREDAQAMRHAGLAHLLAVSGLHLTAVVGAVMLLTLKLLALSPALALRFRLVLVAAAAGALAGIAYTLLTGAQVPTLRACVAALLVLAGIALGREALTLRLVATGALIVLTLWPDMAAGPSFQMSFAALVAIVALHEHPHIRALLSRREEGAAARFGRVVLGLALTGIAVELALTPIALFHFHKSGLYGAAANIVAIPLTTFIVMPLQALALLLDIAGLGAPFWWLAGKALSLLLLIAHNTANSPGALALLPAMPRGAFALMAAGGLWLCLWRTSWRRWGLAPIAAGAVWALTTPAPDLLVTGDGRHLALRSGDGRLAILRPRAGDYVRDTLAELSGTAPNFLDFDILPGATCSADLCAANIDRDGRRWRILATRSRHFVRWDEMVRACAAADIVVSDRRLPRACQPRWLRADPDLLRQTGGIAITFGARPHVATVAGMRGQRPWTAQARGGRSGRQVGHARELGIGDLPAAGSPGP